MCFKTVLRKMLYKSQSYESMEFSINHIIKRAISFATSDLHNQMLEKRICFENTFHDTFEVACLLLTTKQKGQHVILLASRVCFNLFLVLCLRWSASDYFVISFNDIKFFFVFFKRWVSLVIKLQQKDDWHFTCCLDCPIIKDLFNELKQKIRIKSGLCLRRCYVLYKYDRNGNLPEKNECMNKCYRTERSETRQLMKARKEDKLLILVSKWKQNNVGQQSVLSEN